MWWLVNKLKGFLFLVLLFVSSLLGSLVFGGFLLPVFFLHPAVFRHLYDYMIGLWLWFAAVRLFCVFINPHLFLPFYLFYARGHMYIIWSTTLFGALSIKLA